MRPEEPIGQAVRGFLRPLLVRIARSLRAAERGDARALHDARTGLRQARAGILLLGRTVGDASNAHQLARGLRRIERCLGQARDDDVLAGDLARWTRRNGKARRITPLHDKLAQEKATHAQEFVSAIRKRKHSRALEAVREWLDGPWADAANDRRRYRVRDFAHDQIWRGYEEVLASRGSMPFGIRVVHRVRTECRKLRMLVEILRRALSLPGPVIDALRAAQRRLGSLHDDAVASSRIEQWLAEGDVPPERAITAYLTHRTATRKTLRRAFDREWRVLSGRRFQAALFRALCGIERRSKA